LVLKKRQAESGFTPEETAALRALVAAPKFELIPLSTALDQASLLPPGSTVTVTASPAKGLEATLDLAAAVAAMGHPAIPHLSAHMVRDRAHLGDLLQQMADHGLRRAFVVGGDAKDTRAYHDGLSLLRAIDEAGRPLDEVGVPGYPEGHVDISADRLVEVLQEKQPFASYMTTQMCFDPDAIVTWIGRMKANGIALPVHVGMPGVAELRKLMAISARIGVADSARYLKKNRRMVGHLLSPGSFGPDALLEGLAPSLCDPGVDIRALHLFTFNQVEATVQWQQRMLAELDALG
jgi:methylenetetrahydrofolate reductase (NADPH)